MKTQMEEREATAQRLTEVEASWKVGFFKDSIFEMIAMQKEDYFEAYFELYALQRRWIKDTNANKFYWSRVKQMLDELGKLCKKEIADYVANKFDNSVYEKHNLPQRTENPKLPEKVRDAHYVAIQRLFNVTFYKRGGE